MRTVAALVVLASCPEYQLGSEADKAGPGDSALPDDSPPPDTTTPTTPTTPPQEDCDLAPAPADTVAVDPACEEVPTTVVTDPWNLAIEWQWTALPTELGVIVMPAVGNLTDDDGDGAITVADDPDVAFTTWGFYGTMRLVALRGDGSEIFALTGFNGNAGVAIADVTGDGWPEIVALTADSRVQAISGSGAVVWTSDPVVLGYYPQPTVADLDNDGDAEVVFDTAVIDGVTGTVIGTVGGVTASWRTPVVADLDQDGQREIILGNVAAAWNGVPLWSSGGGAYSGNFAAVADIDGDPEGEVLMVATSTLYAYDTDGTQLGTATIPGNNAGPPSVADFDGDGQVEIAVPAGTGLSMFETDGTLRWTAPIQDFSGLAGCSGYDVDGDGQYEVLYADETDLRIYDGATGAVLYQNGSHDSGTLWEYPVVADADNDGSAEILIASNSTYGGFRGVTMFGHAGSGWSKSGPTWGTHDFAVTNLLADGGVPTNETPSWQVHNVFRARPTVDDPGTPDPFLTLDEACHTGCAPDDVFQLPWQVGNGGGAALPPGSVARLFAVVGGSEVEIASEALTDVQSGEVLPGGLFEVPMSSLLGADQYRVRVDGVGIDCNPGDLELTRTAPCP